MKRELLDVRSKTKEAQNDLKCTEGAYSEREAALAERCDSAERRCQELDAELTTAQRDASSGSGQPKTSRKRRRSSSARCPSSKRPYRGNRSDSARKAATQWESRCNELEDALDQSARDFESLRAESERVKEGKQALQEAIDISERELDEKLRARDRQISRLEAQLEKGASRAQRDQEHADELCRAHEKPCRLEGAEHASAVAGAQKRFENSYEKPTRRTLLNLRQLCRERGRRPKHLEGATPRITQRAARSGRFKPRRRDAGGDASGARREPRGPRRVGKTIKADHRHGRKKS